MNIDFEKIAVLVGAVFVGIQGIRATSLKSIKAEMAALQKQLTEFETRLGRSDKRTRSLEVWQYNARLFIGQLRGLLAQNGMEAPEMPHELLDEPHFQEESP